MPCPPSTLETIRRYAHFDSLIVTTTGGYTITMDIGGNILERTDPDLEAAAQALLGDVIAFGTAAIRRGNAVPA